MLKYLRELLQAAPLNDDSTGCEQQETSIPFELGSFAIDDYKPMKVIAIGAGMSGILAAIRCEAAFILDVAFIKQG